MGGFEWAGGVLESIAPVMEWVLIVMVGLFILAMFAFAVAVVKDDAYDRKHRIGTYDDDFYG